MEKRFVSHLLSSAFVILALVAAAPAQAQLRSHELRFVPPTDARVVGFHVYVSGSSMSSADWRDDVNYIPPVDASGAASFVLTDLEAYDDVFIAMKSYDDAGQESAFSNQIVLAAVQECATTGCNDGNPCTRDTCTATGCTFDPAPLVGTSCTDGNASTYGDVCNASGICAGTAGQCNVNSDCPASTNTCSGSMVCSNHVCVAGTPMPNGTSCSDGSSSTRYDVCESGTCRGYACGSDSHCSDAEGCNGVERCVNRVCVAGTPMVCGDGDVCNGTESCRASTCIAGSELQCPLEGGPCFDSYCDPALGCRVETHPNGSACLTSGSGLAGQCNAGLCVADGTPPGGDPGECDAAYGPPADAYQAFTGSSESERKIVWTAPLHPMGAQLDYRADFENKWTSLRAYPESSSGCSAVWSATVTGLKPRVRYFYRVSGAAADGRVWSDSFTLRGGPATSREQFKFAYFASNGLDSSAQSPLASDVLAQIRQGGYPLVLGGGGYALSREAIASGGATDAGAAVLAWKRQASPVIANSIFAPALGDTEVGTYANTESPAHYAEFMAAPGASSAPNPSYSYDFGAAHFVALHAPGLGSIHPLTTEGAAALAWLDADLGAARSSGARWLVVYMHSDLFSSERGDGMTFSVRRGLGAILQRHGVNLVISGEGNSYERSRALLGGLENPLPGPLTNRVVTSRDGIVFVRAGSGGRTAFGTWLSETLPDWSAKRDNTRAVFLGVTANGESLGVVAYGLDENGRRNAIDSVEIR